MTMKGSIDKLSCQGAVGWLRAPNLEANPVVQAFLRQQFLGDSLANLYRPDLEPVGFGDGRRGFEIRFDGTIQPADLPFIEIRPEGVDLGIPLTGVGGYIDL